MWKLFSLFVFLLLGTTGQAQQIKINSNETVDFLLTYTGYNYEGKERNTKFETAYYNSSSIIGYDHHLDDCFVSCAISDDCLGVYQDYNSTLLYEGEGLFTNNSSNNSSNYTCYLLSDLGLNYALTETASNSYTKLKHYNFSEHYSNNIIEIYFN